MLLATADLSLISIDRYNGLPWTVIAMVAAQLIVDNQEWFD